MPKTTFTPVLIIGCSSGVGHALARRFAKSGHPVYATARNLVSIRGLAEAGCNTLRLDVTDADSIREAVDTIEREHGAVGLKGGGERQR